MTNTTTGKQSGNPMPKRLCDARTVVADATESPAAVLWRLTESGRQLDANLVRLTGGSRIDRHAEPDLDVLLMVVAGTGTLASDDGPVPLAAGVVVWLPHGSARSLTAERGGLCYLTVHPRRPGMQIGRRPPTPPPLPRPETRAER